MVFKNDFLNHKMLVICFDKTKVMGGYGDRVTGLISVQIMSFLLGQEFRIFWNKEEDISNYFTYQSIDSFPSKGVIEHDMIDSQTLLKDYLMTSSVPFPDPITKFYLNQEIAQYLLKNPIFIEKDYFSIIFDKYKDLYKYTLIPTVFLMEKVKKCIGNINFPIIGIQIRCGDCYMVTNICEYHNTGLREHINEYLTVIKDQLKSRYIDYAVFVTSDFPGILEETCSVFDNVLYIDDIIQHIDRKPVNSDISKLFADNYILSQKTDELYISIISNYGRVAALSAVHDRIYDVTTAMPVEKRTLLTKHEMLFI